MLVVEQRQRILGARLRARLVIAFVTLTLPRRDMRRTFYFVLPEKGYPREATEAWMQVCRQMDACTDRAQLLRFACAVFQEP